MRRPEIDGFLAISPPANHYDLSFLAPCPASGLIVSGDADSIATPEDVDRARIKGANHFYVDKREELLGVCEEYLLRRLNEADQQLRLEAEEGLDADVVEDEDDFDE